MNTSVRTSCGSDRYSRVDALCDGSHDEEDGLCDLPGRIPIFQRGVQLRTGSDVNERIKVKQMPPVSLKPPED